MDHAKLVSTLAVLAGRLGGIQSALVRFPLDEEDRLRRDTLRAELREVARVCASLEMDLREGVSDGAP